LGAGVQTSAWKASAVSSAGERSVVSRTGASSRQGRGGIERIQDLAQRQLSLRQPLSGGRSRRLGDNAPATHTLTPRATAPAPSGVVDATGHEVNGYVEPDASSPSSSGGSG
jgi:hypothetical protein